MHRLLGIAPRPICLGPPEPEPWQARAPAPCSWVLAKGRLGREHLSPGGCPRGHRLPFDPHPSHPALPKRSRGSHRDSLLHPEKGSAATSSCWATSSSSLGKPCCREANRGEGALAHAESEGLGNFPPQREREGWELLPTGAERQGRGKWQLAEGQG